MTMRVALQMDPLDRLDKKYDTTLHIATAAARRGFSLFTYEPQNLRMEIVGAERKIAAIGHRLTYVDGLWETGGRENYDLSTFDIILMRQDPPFDLAYITATHILEHLTTKVRVVNDPVGVRNAPEKLLITHFPQLMPPTLITRDRASIDEFRARHGDIIIKPLYGHASRGVFHVRPDDTNLAVLTETLSLLNRDPWMVQRFLPDIITEGDKRIILFEGEPVGVFRRLPAKGDIRGALSAGAKLDSAVLTKRDQEICSVLAPVLQSRGLFFAGIDVIGGWLTEINVTSPSGLVDADEIEGRKGKHSLAEVFWDRLL
jgi:glutathione synthase